MQLLIIIVAVFLLNKGNFEKIFEKPQTHETIETKIENQSPIPTSTPSPTQAPKKEVKGANIEVKIATDTNDTKISGDLINDFKYPNAQIESSSENKITLKSSDDSKQITDWYKEKISSKDMNVKSFVTTSTNDNVENKSVAANADFKISVEIKGTKTSGFTILVEISKS